ncbi:glycosyltransferase family 2 protein [Ketobacter sp. MCCC 1A13808]|uniref:glycosyltransferase family 2 protein n=1 Tax=Ketobacter sp. MCCC 1A13808 TaxID=2602738 RepID=UPI0012EC6ED5|nr:glycosyltransferase family 2 protein [Ketobacter sp. MCCC 1A13808]MVF13779.1 glycosyltransferase family 2 protein [Ketobacter sp. MCCC 1A13808]
MNSAIDVEQSLSESVLTGVITHNPDIEQLRWLLSRLEQSGCRVLVVDNNSDNKLDISKLAVAHAQVDLVQSGRNLGVAGALNLMLHEAQKMGVSFIIPFDQDSRPAELAINILFQIYRALDESDKVAAIGMCVVDAYTGRSLGFTSFSFPFNRRCLGYDKNQATVQTDFLITSGCMMSLKAVEDIGNMEEALFIDSVDLEWSFRARSRGWHLLGAFSAILEQTIGQEPLKLPFCNLVVKKHNAGRYYYMTRNRAILYRRSYSNRAWVIKDSVRAILKLFVMLVFREDRFAVLKNHYLGLRDGLIYSKKKLNV